MSSALRWWFADGSDQWLGSQHQLQLLFAVPWPDLGSVSRSCFYVHAYCSRTCHLNGACDGLSNSSWFVSILRSHVRFFLSPMTNALQFSLSSLGVRSLRCRLSGNALVVMSGQIHHSYTITIHLPVSKQPTSNKHGGGVWGSAVSILNGSGRSPAYQTFLVYF